MAKRGELRTDSSATEGREGTGFDHTEDVITFLLRDASVAGSLCATVGVAGLLCAVMALAALACSPPAEWRHPSSVGCVPLTMRESDGALFVDLDMGVDLIPVRLELSYVSETIVWSAAARRSRSARRLQWPAKHEDAVGNRPGSGGGRLPSTAARRARSTDLAWVGGVAISLPYSQADRVVSYEYDGILGLSSDAGWMGAQSRGFEVSETRLCFLIGNDRFGEEPAALRMEDAKASSAAGDRSVFLSQPVSIKGTGTNVSVRVFGNAEGRARLPLEVHGWTVSELQKRLPVVFEEAVVPPSCWDNGTDARPGSGNRTAVAPPEPQRPRGAGAQLFGLPFAAFSVREFEGDRPSISVADTTDARVVSLSNKAPAYLEARVDYVDLRLSLRGLERGRLESPLRVLVRLLLVLCSAALFTSVLSDVVADAERKRLQNRAEEEEGSSEGSASGEREGGGTEPEGVEKTSDVDGRVSSLSESRRYELSFLRVTVDATALAVLLATFFVYDFDKASRWGSDASPAWGEGEEMHRAGERVCRWTALCLGSARIVYRAARVRANRQRRCDVAAFCALIALQISVSRLPLTSPNSLIASTFAIGSIYVGSLRARGRLEELRGAQEAGDAAVGVEELAFECVFWALAVSLLVFLAAFTVAPRTVTRFGLRTYELDLSVGYLSLPVLLALA